MTVLEIILMGSIAVALVVWAVVRMAVGKAESVVTQTGFRGVNGSHWVEGSTWRYIDAWGKERVVEGRLAE